jgi:hypothetical protein
MKTDNGLVEAQRHSIERSPEWHKVELLHLKRQPRCQCCSRVDSIQTHHIFPFHYCIALGRADLELYDGIDGTGTDGNLISLCETSEKIKTDDHHLLLGHLKDFKSSNLRVKEDVKIYSNLTQNQILLNETYKLKLPLKLKPLDEMTQQEKDDLRNLMDKTFPLKN